jgi:fatty acid desaturase
MTNLTTSSSVAVSTGIAAERTSIEPGGRGELDALARRLVSDLHRPRPAVFWLDLAASAAIGWTAFAFAAFAAPPVGEALAASIVAGLALYRGLCFTHELTHLRRAAIPGFETTWNCLIGVPFLLPSFTYVGVHQSHHHLATYGTKDDPEYLPFASSRRLIFLFAIQASLVTPLVLVLRFLLLSPVGFVWPRFHRWLEARASSFSMNPAYRRIVSAAMSWKMRRWEAGMFAAWAAILAGVYRGVLPFRILVVWYLVLVFVSFLNALRVLGAHRYESEGLELDREGQLIDSIDTPGGPWSVLWAPVGLRYHALHHYFPGIPYHNLGVAYRRLIETLPSTSVYRESTSPSLPSSLARLYRTAKLANDARCDRFARRRP